MAAIFWWTRLIAFGGSSMTLNSTIRPDSFHLVEVDAIDEYPVDLGLELEHGVERSDDLADIAEGRVEETWNAAVKYQDASFLPRCGVWTTGE
jgi:hypothetical protein